MADVFCPKCNSCYDFSGDENRKLECPKCHCVFTVNSSREERGKAAQAESKEILVAFCVFFAFLLFYIILWAVFN